MYGLSSKGAFAFDHALSPATKEEGMQEAHPFMPKKKVPMDHMCLFWSDKADSLGLEEVPERSEILISCQPVGLACEGYVCWG